MQPIQEKRRSKREGVKERRGGRRGGVEERRGGRRGGRRGERSTGYNSGIVPGLLCCSLFDALLSLFLC